MEVSVATVMPHLWEKADLTALRNQRNETHVPTAAAKWRGRSQERATEAEPTFRAGPCTEKTGDSQLRWKKGVYTSAAAHCRNASFGI